MALPALKHRVPLKPISTSPLCSRTRLRRERLPWGSLRTGPLTTKGGSEESGSSSSQSSIDLEDEEEDDVHETASGESHLKFVGDRLLQPSNDVSAAQADLVGRHFNVQPRIRHIPPIHRPAHNSGGEPINYLSTEKVVNSHCEGKDTNVNYTGDAVDSQSFIKCNNARPGDTINNKMPIIPKTKERLERATTETGISNGTAFNMNYDQDDTIAGSEGNCRNDLQHIKQTERTMTDCQVDNPNSHREDVNLQTAEERNQSFTSTVNIPQSNIDLKKDERMLKALKPVRSKERRTSTTCERRANIQANKQSFNILAHKDQSFINSNKSKSSLKYSSLSTQVKDKTRKSPELTINRETVTKVKSKLKSFKGAHCSIAAPSPRKKVTDHVQSKRSYPDKLSSNTAQQQPAVREQEGTRQLKRPGLTGTPRSQSAVDFITYKDMFQQIQSGDEGPAIYEMFAGPIYDNLRVSSSCDKARGRQVQSAKVTHRPLNQAQSKVRRSPAERMVVSAKTKPSSRVKPQLTSASRKNPHKMKAVTKLDGHTEAELVLSKDVDIILSCAQEQAEDPMLSTIEESLPGYGSDTLKSDDKTLAMAVDSSHAEHYSQMYMNMQEKKGNSSIGKPKRSVHDTALSQTPRQPKINTWTSSSSSSNTIMSPVYQKFLDEAGDGPLTDDLLQCLAEELISLDERDVSIGPCPEMLEPSKEKSKREDDLVSERNMFPEVKSCRDNNMTIKKALAMHISALSVVIQSCSFITPQIFESVRKSGGGLKRQVLRFSTLLNQKMKEKNKETN